MAQPSSSPYPAFQTFNALNALSLGAAWDASPARSEAVWRGFVARGSAAWAQRFAPLIDQLSGPAPTVRPPRY